MNNKQKKYRFNIIDVLIILTVLAIGVVMYYYMSARNSVASSLETEIEYTVELKTVHKDYVDNIKEGDHVFETVREQQIGEVVSVEISPAYNIATDTLTGEMYVSYYPEINVPEDTTQEYEPEYEYYNVKVGIKGKFKKSDKGYSINAFDLVIGQLVYMRVPEYVGQGYCIAINELEGEVA